MPERLLLLVPSLKAPSETFIRANAVGLPFDTVVVCGDEIPLEGAAATHRLWAVDPVQQNLFSHGARLAQRHRAGRAAAR